MTGQVDSFTCDAFLGGALSVRQPKIGYRAATDPVFLAASISAHTGQTVLELGCGVGVAILCLGQRIPGLEITGLEIQEEYADFARTNMQENNISANILSGDLMKMPKTLRGTAFDHVMFNPPFFDAAAVSAPQNAGKSRAHVTAFCIDDWILASMKRLKPRGRLTFIHRVEILPLALACLSDIAGDIVIKPLASRVNQVAKRVIITCRKGTNGPTLLSPALIVHKEGAHIQDAGAYSKEAEAILRNAQKLNLFPE